MTVRDRAVQEDLHRTITCHSYLDVVNSNSRPATRYIARRILLRPHRYALFSPTIYEWRVDTLPTLPTYVLYCFVVWLLFM